MSAPVAVVATKLSPADHDYPQLLAETLQRFGWNVVIFPAEQIRNTAAFRDGFRLLLQRTAARAVLSVNFSGLLAELSLELGFVYLAWNEVYPLQFEIAPLRPGNSVFCFESSRSMSDWWRGKNVNARFFPLGFDPRVFRPRGDARDLPLSFVGNGLAHMRRTLDRLAGEVAAAAAATDVPLRREAYRAVSRFLDVMVELPFADFEAVRCDLDRLIEEHCRALPAALPREVRGAVSETLLNARPTIKGWLSRRQRIDTLTRVAGLGLRVFGRDWDETPVAARASAPVLFAATAEIYARSRVSLHIQRFYAHNVNDRIFNVPASHGFLLTRAAEGIEELFEPDREIAVYRDLGDLEEKARRYLADGAERERQRMADAACRRAHAQYRIERRLWEALGTCGLPRPQQPPA